MMFATTTQSRFHLSLSPLVADFPFLNINLTKTTGLDPTRLELPTELDYDEQQRLRVFDLILSPNQSNDAFHSWRAQEETNND